MSLRNFARAQAAYDNAEPPDWDGSDVQQVECKETVSTVVTNILGFDEDVDEECTFTGKVDVYYAGDMQTWDCPECGATHEDEVDGPDPDDQRDAMLDR
jgi:rubrerythrin